MLPRDPEILLSMINTKLRDSYSSFEELCGETDEDKDELEAILDRAGYKYDAALNRFVAKGYGL